MPLIDSDQGLTLKPKCHEEDLLCGITFNSIIEFDLPGSLDQTPMITLKIPESSHSLPAKLSVCDLGGRLIRTLINGSLPSGYFVTEWDRKNESGNQAPSGSYLLIWEQGDLRHIERLVVVY